MADVFLNGKFTGTVESPDKFVKQVREERRQNKIVSDLNISYTKDSDTVTIEMGGGRARRPLIIIEDAKSTLTDDRKKQLEKNEISWSDLIKEGIIEYLDAEEEENALVAFYEHELTPEHTHLEIAPIDILGMLGSLVPYANFSPQARVLMGAKYQKQALGFYTANYPIRIDTDVSLLHSPQVPIVKSMMHDVIDYAKHPAGQNIIVAVMSYQGYNMDDATIINKSSVERGLARSTYYKPAVSEELRYSGGLVDEISIPDKDVKGYKSEEHYKLLQDDGIIYPEAEVKEEDVIIGKTSPPRFLSSADEYSLTTNLRREASYSLGHGSKGVIDFVLLTENEEGNKLVQVRMRDQRTPEIGDKFASRQGQKGVIGLLLPESDMPFTSTGMIPDLIFSPHSVPTRMTVSHLLELMAGKVGSLSGRQIDGTAFDAEPEKDLREELFSLGFRENGTETLYNGITGEQFKAKIYIGNMYYLKLKYMVANRLQSRARGPIQLLTRQPTEGRAKEGGLRLGEMEKDTFVAHGASLLLKERFDSDKTVVPVCEECGLIAVQNTFKNQYFCSVCGDNIEINNIEIAYAFKLILDEFKSLGVYPRIKLENKY